MRLVYSCGASPEQPDMHPLHWRSTCQNRVSARSIAGVLKGDFCPFRGVRRPVIGDASNVRFCLATGGACNPRVIIDRGLQRLRHPKGPRTQVTHLDLNTLSYLQSILDLDTKVPHGARHIRVSQQQLNGSKIFGLLVNQCRFATSH